MSVKAMSWAFGMKIEPVKKVILLSLADCADDSGGSCFPGYALLAEKSSVCKKTVQRNITKLVDMGLIVKRNRRNGSRHNSNDYKLLLDVTEPLIKPKATSQPAKEPEVKKSAETENNTNLPVDNKSIPKESEPMDNESTPQELQPVDNKSIPMDPIESTPMDSIVSSYPSLTTTNPDTDSDEENSDSEFGIFGSHLITGCHPYLYWFLRTMEQKAESQPDSCSVFSERLARFGLSGGYCQTALTNFLRAKRAGIDRHALNDLDATGCSVISELLEAWPQQAEEFIREADESLELFREELLKKTHRTAA